MRLWHKLLAGYAVLLAATGVVGFVGQRGAHAIAADFHRVNKESLPLLTALKDLRLAGLRLVSTSMETAFLLERQSHVSGRRQQVSEQEELEEGREAFEAVLADCGTRMRGIREGEAPFFRLEQEGKLLLEASERFLQLAQRNASTREVLEVKASFEVRERAFLSLVEEIHNQERVKLDLLEAEAFRGVDQATSANAWVGTAALIVSLLLGVTISASISRRVEALEGAARRVAAGDLSHRLEVASSDEVGRLSLSFNRMVESLKTSREDLASANTYLDGLITAMMDGLMVVSQSGEIQDANPSCCRSLGYGRQELVGRNLRAFFPSQSEGELMLKELRSQGRVADREIFLVAQGGAQLAFVFSASLLDRGHDSPEAFVCLLHDISHRKQAEARIRNLAYYDQLTGLANRALFLDRLEQAIAVANRDRKPLALLFFDLDRFKDVNDTQGHEAGDELLRQVAFRLGGMVRKSDTLARLGGDEFVLLCLALHDAAETTLVARRMQEFLNEPFLIDGKEIHTGASIGIVLHPADGQDASSLLRNADLAMYAAKAAGGQQYKFFSEEMNRKAQDRAVLEVGLRSPALDDQLQLHYQPLIDLPTGRVLGAEALCRWFHPEMGSIPPDRFIPVAEQTGIIRYIGEWVLKTACHQAKAWEEAGLDLKIWVNVSAAQLARPDFPEQVASILRGAGLSSARLGLELTESLLMGVEREASVMIRRLKELGLALAIDDFGTGYSSLSYLRDFDVDKLKIDRSFVTDLPMRPDAAAIVKAVIAMGHSLGLRVTAEGIETDAECQDLKAHGCDEGQGYLFSKPVEILAFERLLRGRG